MAPRDSSAEDQAQSLVLDWVRQQNRPVNAQNAADAMQKHGLKKAQVQKALDSLAVPASSGANPETGDSGDTGGPVGAGGTVGACLVYKEYGKQRIYMARQDTLQVLTPVEKEALVSRLGQLKDQAQLLQGQCSHLESERGALEGSLTLPQMQQRIQHLQAQNAELEARAAALRGAAGGVSTEERQQVEQQLGRCLGLWRKRKRIFRELWDTVTEGYPRSLKELQEDLGIETDEDVGCSFAALESLNAVQPSHHALSGTKRKEPVARGRPVAEAFALKNRVLGPKPGGARGDATKQGKPPKARKK